MISGETYQCICFQQAATFRDSHVNHGRWKAINNRHFHGITT